MTDLTVDAVVMGAGLAGITCALRLAQAGKSVLVAEKGKDERYPCNTRMSGGVFHVCLTDILSDPALLKGRILEETGYSAREDLAEAVATDAIRAVRWLQNQGIRFVKGSPDPWHNFVLAPPAINRIGGSTEGRSGDVLLRTLERQLLDLGGELHRGLHGQQLVGDAGRCLGMTALQENGQSVTILAGATIICDGGFQSNSDLLRENISALPERLLQRNSGQSVGDGLKMVSAFGGKVTDLSGFYGHLQSAPSAQDSRYWPYPWLDYLALAGIVVDAYGRRFCDEGLGGVSIANAVARQPDPDKVWVIFDHNIWEGPGRARFIPPNPNLLDLEGAVIQSDTLSELADRIALPAENLCETVISHNSAIAKNDGSSLTPCRSFTPQNLWPIEEAPYFAAPIIAGITHTMGGIEIDANSQVLSATKDSIPIPGLYAAGACTGGLEGGEKPGYVGGLVKSAVTGLRASEQILRDPQLV
ncbi:FAD-dependent oxidoreductase [Hoeflea poritis]|uniref:FAD-binding protein n=1 Tax=Hoeflea poritis TaxID=2993659 RepID=A0ABT4VUY8_9HYPH|nr:FAD-dependent oxidoreductase [Hoeflea poritis]MDA4848526.1 FAD-binding protein [Hoeflea poritis]